MTLRTKLGRIDDVSRIHSERRTKKCRLGSAREKWVERRRWFDSHRDIASDVNAKAIVPAMFHGWMKDEGGSIRYVSINCERTPLFLTPRRFEIGEGTVFYRLWRIRQCAVSIGPWQSAFHVLSIYRSPPIRNYINYAFDKVSGNSWNAFLPPPFSHCANKGGKIGCRWKLPSLLSMHLHREFTYKYCNYHTPLFTSVIVLILLADVIFVYWIVWKVDWNKI